MQLIGAVVQIGFLIFDLVDADGHGVQRRRTAKVESPFLRHLLKLLLTRFFACQNLADKFQLVIHFTGRAQFEQQLVLQHHLDIQNISYIVVGDVGQLVCCKLLLHLLQHLNLVEQLPILGIALAQITTRFIGQSHQTDNAGDSFPQGKHLGFQHLAGCGEDGKTFVCVHRSQNFLLLDIHLEGGRELSGNFNRAHIGQFADQQLFCVGDVDLEQALPFLHSDFIYDLCLTVNAAPVDLDLVQFKKNGVAHDKQNRKAKCRKQNIMEKIFSDFAKGPPFWRAA